MAVCAVCLRSLSTTSTGVLRAHGPLTARCPGSGKPPRPLAVPLSGPSSQVAPSPHGHQSPSPSSPPVAPSLETIPKFRVLRRIPRAARLLCCSKMTAILNYIVKFNSVASWNRLFLFAPRCLRQPQKGTHSESLSTMVKCQLQENESTIIAPPTT